MNFDNLMQKVRDAAAGGINAMSTGEALAAALVLNRADWLKAMDYTIAEALDRIDPDTIPLLRRAQRAYRQEQGAMARVEEIKNEAATVADVLGSGDAGDYGVYLSSALVTYSEAPGYRGVTFTFDVAPVGSGSPKKPRRIELSIRPEDAESIVTHLLHVHRFAWKSERGPLDRKDGETRPAWLDTK